MPGGFALCCVVIFSITNGEGQEDVQLHNSAEVSIMSTGSRFTEENFWPNTDLLGHFLSPDSVSLPV